MGPRDQPVTIQIKTHSPKESESLSPSPCPVAKFSKILTSSWNPYIILKTLDSILLSNPALEAPHFASQSNHQPRYSRTSKPKITENAAWSSILPVCIKASREVPGPPSSHEPPSWGYSHYAIASSLSNQGDLNLHRLLFLKEISFFSK